MSTRLDACFHVTPVWNVVGYPEVSSPEFQSVLKRYFEAPVGDLDTLEEMREHLEAIGVINSVDSVRLEGQRVEDRVYLIVNTYRAIQLIKE